MNNHNDVEKIKKMTFKELRNELVNCTNNPIREKIIRNMMILRYNQHMERKRIYEIRKAERLQKKMMKKQQNSMVDNNENDNDEQIILDENDYEYVNPTYRSLNELDEQSNDEDFRPVREIKEQERDKLNDNLVSRLNNDLELRNGNEKNKEKKVDIIPPFSNDTGDMYAPFESIHQNKKKDFSNPKFSKYN